MSSPLDSRNPHGIRVVADRGPVRGSAQAAFAHASRNATKGISGIVRPRNTRQGTSAAATRKKK